MSPNTVFQYEKTKPFIWQKAIDAAVSPTSSSTFQKLVHSVPQVFKTPDFRHLLSSSSVSSSMWRLRCSNSDLNTRQRRHVFSMFWQVCFFSFKSHPQHIWSSPQALGPSVHSPHTFTSLYSNPLHTPLSKTPSNCSTHSTHSLFTAPSFFHFSSFFFNLVIFELFFSFIFSSFFFSFFLSFLLIFTDFFDIFLLKIHPDWGPSARFGWFGKVSLPRQRGAAIGTICCQWQGVTNCGKGTLTVARGACQWQHWVEMARGACHW